MWVLGIMRQHVLTHASCGGTLGQWTSKRAHASTVFPDEGMLHALRHHWRAYETDKPAVVMFVGPSTIGEPLEIGVVTDGQGAAIIHAMVAREKFLKGW